MNDTSEWADRATKLYGSEYARRYREHDNHLDDVEANRAFYAWLRQVCASFNRPIDVLDLGCGTGRYFRALTNVRSLVGIDASAAMLDEARHPVDAERVTASSIELIHADIVTHGFEAARFDLVYSIGVLAEHLPLDAALVEKVHRWLTPGGRFAFTTVHPDSPSVRRTAGRALGRLVLPVAWGPVRRRLHARITAGGLYADEELVRSRLEPRFTIESLTPFESEVHLHCLCVARKAVA